MRIYIIVLTIVVISFDSCVSDKEEGVVISDATIYNLVKSSSFSFYKNKADTLKADPLSPHLSFLRVSFNPMAQSVMNDSLGALTASSFPDESMIVKEIYDIKGGGLQRYSVMYKLRGAANNGSGWVWNELRPDGSVIYSTAHKGDQCVSCHAEGVNSDLVRTFALH
jgi:Cytochrome P460